MKRKASRIGLAALLAAVAMLAPAGAAVPQSHHHGSSDPTAAGAAGAIRTTCRPAVAGLLAQGVQHLHEFAFDSAVGPFRTAAHSDVDCAMAHWGLAMAHWGRFAGSGSTDALAAGWQGLDFAALSRRPASDRERRYLAAVGTRYRHRLANGPLLYATEMHELATAFPDDAHAQLFSALAQVQLAESGQPDAPARREAALAALDDLKGRANEVARLHYSILAADHPAFADRALHAATELAGRPDASAYLLHLPSHLFARRGMWEEVISANLRSADAARRVGGSADELHALDALSYAYLQAGRTDEAVAIAARIAGGYLRHRETPRTDDGRAAIVARVALDAGDCRAAARLDDSGATGRGLELIRLARAVGAARCGDSPSATAAAGTLDGKGLAGLSANAWAAFARGGVSDALETMRRAADLERATTVEPWTGPVFLAREQLAEMLLLAGRPGEAAAAFQEVLTFHPGRARAVEGLARAGATAPGLW